MTAHESLRRDFQCLMGLLLKAEARFLMVGAYAVAAHALPRATAALDLWVEATPQNAQRTWTALAEFGAPLRAMNVRPEDLAKADLICQVGVAPRRIDILTKLSGVTFDAAWDSRIEARFGDSAVPIIGLDALIKNKRATGRPKDLLDVEVLERTRRNQHTQNL